MGLAQTFSTFLIHNVIILRQKRRNLYARSQLRNLATYPRPLFVGSVKVKSKFFRDFEYCFVESNANEKSECIPSYFSVSISFTSSLQEDRIMDQIRITISSAYLLQTGFVITNDVY